MLELLGLTRRLLGIHRSEARKGYLRVTLKGCQVASSTVLLSIQVYRRQRRKD